MTEEELVKLLLEAATLGDDGRRRLTCEQAFSMQAQHAIPLTRIAAACNTAKIRISECQLGCFR